jgi:holo-[acyl-carrier protein] synthase
LIFGTGIDVIELDRLRKIVDNDENEIIIGTFTASEINICRSDKDSAKLYAGLFAAKEAFLKALGTGLRYGVSWKEIEISKNNKHLTITTSGNAADRCDQNKIKNIHLSIRHSEEAATAVVILER